MQTNKILLYFFMLSILISNVLALEEVLVGTDTIDGRENKFLADEDSIIAMLVPVLMLMISLVFFAVDFGSVGVITTLLASLIFTSMIGILAISVTSIACGVIMGGILLYKITR